MAKIADTLNDIQKLQDLMSERVNDCRELSDGRFIRDLMNFTTVYFFSLLSHATLDALRDRLSPFPHPYAEKYYSMYKQNGLLQEFIRLDNISGVFVLWNIFEQYIDRTRAGLPGNPERNLEDRYKRILLQIGIDQTAYGAMVNEFNLIRLTRNSLHGGGAYRNSRKFSYRLCGKDYLLEMGKNVTPIRLMDIAETIWKHFVAVTDGSDGSERSLVTSR